MDTSPTALFDSYEQDFNQILSSVRSKLDGDAKDQKGGGYYTMISVHPQRNDHVCQAEQRKATLRRVDMEVEEADEIVRSLSPTFLLVPLPLAHTKRSGLSNGG